MDTRRKRVAVTVGSALAAAAIVTGGALGANSGSSATSASPPAVTAHKAPATTPAEPTMPDTDQLQEGDQTAPDASAPEGAEESPAAENGHEQAEPGEPALLGGGHADAPGQNVDHQFDGVE